jgi:hypothetical protein
MTETKRRESGTIAQTDETKDPFRETIEIAVGPNTTGHEDLARAAHDLAPDPAAAPGPDASPAEG